MLFPARIVELAVTSLLTDVLQRPQDGHHRFRIERAERFDQARRIDRAQLIESDKASAALEAASRPPRVHLRGR